MKYYVNKQGLMVQETKFKIAPIEVTGIKATELWGDAMQRNISKRDGSEVLLPHEALPVIEHEFNKRRFIESGGGFRLDFSYV